MPKWMEWETGCFEVNNFLHGAPQRTGRQSLSYGAVEIQELERPLSGMRRHSPPSQHNPKNQNSSLAIETLSGGTKKGEAAVAYVYCDFSVQNAQSAKTVLASVLRQVVGALAQIPDEVQKAFEHAKTQVNGRGLRLQGILDLLVLSLSRLRKGFICIDALDEFPANHRAELWESLQRVIRQCPNSRLFLTGRPQISIEVENYFPEHADVVIITPALNDIKRYIEKRLKENINFNAMGDELRAEILRVIPGRISGIFLLVRIIMDAILAEATIHQRRRALHRMTKGLSLQNAYNTTLNRIREQGGGKAKLGMDALMWISHCARPLRPQELCHALGVELGMEDIRIDNVLPIQDVLGYTFGLLTFDENESTVRLLHLTLQEYLEHHTVPVTAHSMMAEICLTYLNFRSVRGLPPDFDNSLGTIPFLEYAACFWGTHATGKVTGALESLALRLLGGYENHASAAILWRKKIKTRYWEKDVRGITGLHCIAFWGIEEIAISMLEGKRWDVNDRDSRDETPLMWAVKHGNNRIVELFPEQEDIKPDMVLKDGRTVFSFAAGSGKEDAVKLLLAHQGVNPNAPDNDGRTPLSHAVTRGYKGVVKLILEHVDVNPNPSENYVLTPLFYAASSGRQDMVKLLLELGGVDPNSSDDSGQSLLSYAASGGHDGVVKLLLERGDVDPDLSDSCDRTPLSYAVWEGHKGVVKLLLRCGDADPNLSDSYGRTPLSYAASRGHGGVVKLFLEYKGVDPNSWDNKGWGPLSYAASGGHECVVKLLVESPDIDLGIPDSNGITPLSYAAKWGREDLVELFLKRDGVNPDSLDTMGRTPLSYASSGGHIGVVRLLLERGGVNPNSPDGDGRIALSYAAWGGHEGLVELLLKSQDTDPDSWDYEGRTPLSYASSGGHIGVVRLLLERGGVDPDSPDRDGRTPLSYAASGKHWDLEKLLLKWYQFKFTGY